MTSSYDLNFSIDLNHIDQDHLHRHQPSAALIIPEDHNSPDQRQFNYLSLSHINDNNKPPVVDAASSSSSSTCSNSSSYSSSISLFHPTPQPQPPPPPYNCPVYFNPSSQDHHQAAAAAAPAPAGICYEYDSPKLVVDLDQINKMELHQYQNQTTATAAAPGVEINNMISRRREIINSPVVKWKVRRLIMKKKTTKTDHNKKRQKQTPLGDDDEHAPESDINVHVCTVNATVRVCADCNTTKTPLWRSGPRGPKSLCNACGIRQRKARRAAILAANNTGSVTGSGLSQVTTSTTTTMRSYSSTNNNINHHNNKTPKVANDKPLSSPAPPTHAQGQGQAQAQAHHYCHDRINQRKQICFEEFAHSLTKNLSIQQILFPQEEKDAAILLMALSCDALISIPN